MTGGPTKLVEACKEACGGGCKQKAKSALMFFAVSDLLAFVAGFFFLPFTEARAQSSHAFDGSD